MFICILGLLAVSLWSTSAFAQSSLSVSSVPRTTATSTGHTEIAGDILVSGGVVGGLGAGSATLTVDYGVPITVPTTQATPWSLTICGTGYLVGTGGGACPGGVGVLYAPNTNGAPGTFSIGGANQNQLLIVMPAAAAAATAGTITINNVKVSLAALTPPTKLTVSLGVSASQTFGAYSIGSGQNTTDVITAIAPAFTSLTATPSSTPTTAPIAITLRGQILSTATVVCLMVSATRITVVILELIRAPNPDFWKGCIY